MGHSGPTRDSELSLRTTEEAESQKALASLIVHAEPDRATEIADRLIGRFGSIGGIFAHTPEGITTLLSDAPGALRLLTATRSAMIRSLTAEVGDLPIAHGKALIEFLQATMAYLGREQVRVLFLSRTNRLILDEIMSFGSRYSAPIYHREILKRALEVDATALILVHNHPSGNPAPSEKDKIATQKLAAAAATLDIVLHDHLIVARSGWVSFVAMGLLHAR